jgi:hypothetical protein
MLAAHGIWNQATTPVEFVKPSLSGVGQGACAATKTASVSTLPPRRNEPPHMVSSRCHQRFSFVYRAGSKSSIGFPSGSSTWIYRPPGPASI